MGAPEFEPAPGWAPTRALGRAVLLAGVLVLLAVVLGRVDLVALAAPFALGTAWALRARPVVPPQIELELPEQPVSEGSAVTAQLRVANPAPLQLDAVVTRLSHSRWLRLRSADRPYASDPAPGHQIELGLRGTALRWGHHEIGPAVAYGVACDALLISTRALGPAGEVRVHPLMPAFRADEVMPRTAARVGTHRSRRTGEGGELAGVRQYGPGDRLRRIDWRVTLRTRQLHVAETLSDRDAEVVVLLDVLREAGRSGGINGPASVVDTTVRAAAAIVEHYLRQGDRVAMIEYSGHPRYLRGAGGRVQLQMALEWLLHTRATADAGGQPAFGIDPHLIPGSALVVVLTPLLSSQSAEMIATLARAGRLVMAVDTLGTIVGQPLAGAGWTPIAYRLWRLDRANTIGQLREVGVPVTGWAGAGSLDEVLRDMRRLAAAPRVVLR